MGWTRTRIRFGARLALIALAVQIVLSFGHVHLHGVNIASHPAAAAPYQTALTQVPSRIPAPAPADDDYCAICASIFLVSTSFVATPPLLPVPSGFERIEHFLVAAHAAVTPRRTPFQSRAPPAA